LKKYLFICYNNTITTGDVKMYDIFATDLSFEQCSGDKKKIDMLFPYAVIHFVLSGHGCVNGEKISEGTAFVSYINNRMSYYPSREDPWSYIYIRLGGNDLKKAFEDCGFESGLTVIPFDFKERLWEILSLYNGFSGINDPDGARIIANAVFFLMKKRIATGGFKTKPRQHAERIKSFIDENYYKKITVRDMAERVYLNKNYVRTVFFEVFGVSPKQYLQRVRMNRAEFLLRTTDEDVKLIANSVGYDDALLFSKTFKAAYGISPLGFRLKKEDEGEIKKQEGD